MIYRDTATGRIDSLPWRVRMPDGSTRTDPDQWASDPDALAASGFVVTDRTPADDVEPTPPAPQLPATVDAKQVRLWLLPVAAALGITEQQVVAAFSAPPCPGEGWTLDEATATWVQG